MQIKSSIIKKYSTVNYVMGRAFWNITALSAKWHQAPPQWPKLHATFSLHLCLCQKASAQDWYPRPDTRRRAAWRTNHQRKIKGIGGDERSYTTEVWCRSQDLWLGFVSRRLNLAIAVLDLDCTRVYNEPSKFIKGSGFCMAQQINRNLYNEP